MTTKEEEIKKLTIIFHETVAKFLKENWQKDKKLYEREVKEIIFCSIVNMMVNLSIALGNNYKKKESLTELTSYISSMCEIVQAAIIDNYGKNDDL